MDRTQEVSMPLRAFFVFPHSSPPITAWAGPSPTRFNALTGILCFSTAYGYEMAAATGKGFQCPYGHSLFFHYKNWQYYTRADWFQCPYGHSLFFHGFTVTRRAVRRQDVSMPLRAFFVFPRDYFGWPQEHPVGFNALTGILCFSTL